MAALESPGELSDRERELSCDLSEGDGDQREADELGVEFLDASEAAAEEDMGSVGRFGCENP